MQEKPKKVVESLGNYSIAGLIIDPVLQDITVKFISDFRDAHQLDIRFHTPIFVRISRLDNRGESFPVGKATLTTLSDLMNNDVFTKLGYDFVPTENVESLQGEFVLFQADAELFLTIVAKSYSILEAVVEP